MNTGFLVGRMDAGSINIYNNTFKGSITGTAYVGLFGSLAVNSPSSFFNNIVNVSINGTSNAGIFAGYISGSSSLNISNWAVVSSFSSSGGQSGFIG